MYKTLEDHWGPGYLANLDLARGVIADFAPPSLRKALETSGLGNSPDVLLLFGAIGLALQQARQAAKPGPGAGAPAALSAEQAAEDAIAKVMANPAYFDDRHPDHKRVVAESHRLFEARYRD